MLVVTRRLDERIIIGDPRNPIAVVTVCRISGSSVRIGVQAEQSIPILRHEHIGKGRDKPKRPKH